MKAKKTASDKVLSIFKRRKTGGATTDEIELASGLSHQTASARVNELTQRGILKKTPSRRFTRYGRPAYVYIYVKPSIATPEVDWNPKSAAETLRSFVDALIE